VEFDAPADCLMSKYAPTIWFQLWVILDDTSYILG